MRLEIVVRKRMWDYGRNGNAGIKKERKTWGYRKEGRECGKEWNGEKKMNVGRKGLQAKWEGREW